MGTGHLAADEDEDECGDEPGGEPSGRAEVPSLTGGPSVTEAAVRATFPLLVPDALGEPDGVEVAAGGNRVSMTWGQGTDTVRLDQVAGSPDFAVIKQAPRLRFATVDGSAHTASADAPTPPMHSALNGTSPSPIRSANALRVNRPTVNPNQ